MIMNKVFAVFRIYENFVFSLKIYPDNHYQKVLCYQVLEKMDKLFHDYQKLGLPTVQLVQCNTVEF